MPISDKKFLAWMSHPVRMPESSGVQLSSGAWNRLLDLAGADHPRRPTHTYLVADYRDIKTLVLAAKAA